MDVHGIPLGVNFRTYLNEQVARADLLLALIADRWLTSADEGGQRRIDSPNDFGRIEIEAALKRGIPVVPVYAHDTKFLHEADLPSSLKELAWMNGFQLSTDPRYFSDGPQRTSGSPKKSAANNTSGRVGSAKARRRRFACTGFRKLAFRRGQMPPSS